ncbi:co-chaperone GroES [Weissella diestrammenae]|uniref:Co-chaperonin GroES n=1 Tax=Weissella diestrammenae TaxID=1162633 RepID=A0A7G9T459_9LACO|nr:co-chaperone GroES [Weissella diestrammenae]MCM0583408.1 co-chaperone GroES [Weissella diestrammenae]QNN74884.1 co-chaperone GroES [Weissella diestrammenae]
MLKPLGDRILLQVEQEQEQTVGGIVIASNAQEKSTIGKVVAISDKSIGDLQAPTAVKVGDEVLFDKYAGTEVKNAGETYLVVHEKDLIAVL